MVKKLKILHITKKYPNAIGGDATAVSALEKEQKKAGHEVFILTTNCDEIIDKKNVIKFGLKDTPSNLDKITFKRIISLIELRFKVSKILREIKPNIVHSHSVDMGYVISKNCQKLGIPIVNHLHAGLFYSKEDNLIRKKIMNHLLKRSKFERLIAINKNDFKEANKKHFKVSLIPNGLDLTKFNNKKVEKEEGILLFIGRLEEYKGLRYLIESVNLIKNKVKTKLLIVGEGSYLEECKKMRDKFKLQNEISFLGKLSFKNLIPLYKKSAVFILPSYTSSETFGIVLLESLACKTPVITTDIVGIADEIKNNNCGIVVETKNSNVLAKAIVKILKNPRLARQIGNNGRKLVERKYIWKTLNKDIEKIYEEIVKK